MGLQGLHPALPSNWGPRFHPKLQWQVPQCTSPLECQFPSGWPYVSLRVPSPAPSATRPAFPRYGNIPKMSTWVYSAPHFLHMYHSHSGGGAQEWPVDNPVLWPGVPQEPVCTLPERTPWPPPTRAICSGPRSLGFVSTRVHVKMDKSGFLLEATLHDPKVGLMCVAVRQGPLRATPSLPLPGLPSGLQDPFTDGSPPPRSCLDIPRVLLSLARLVTALSLKEPAVGVTYSARRSVMSL